MRRGDFVVYLAIPERYGKGEIKQVRADGRLEVEFSHAPGGAYIGSFDPPELELLSVWVEGHDLDYATLAETDFAVPFAEEETDGSG